MPTERDHITITARSEEVAATDALLRANGALRAELERTQADAALYRQALEIARPVLERYEPCGYYCDEAIGHVDHPATSTVASALFDRQAGLSLLAELEQSRAIVGACQARMNETGMCPICGGGTDLIDSMTYHVEQCPLGRIE